MNGYVRIELFSSSGGRVVELLDAEAFPIHKNVRAARRVYTRLVNSAALIEWQIRQKKSLRTRAKKRR